MRWLLALMIGLLLMPAAANADVRVKVRAGGIGFVAGDSEAGDRTGRRDARREHRRRDRHRGRGRQTRILIVPVPERRRTVTRPVPPPPQPADPPPVTVAPAEVQPLDPSGSARRVRARSAGQAPALWQIGQPLPASLPHVTLAPGPYGLPDPPPGEIYARVGRDVLRIDAATRIVIARVERAP